jgi:hypothetical protein
MWVWDGTNDGFDVLNNSTDRSDLFTFLEDPHDLGQPINRIFFQAREYEAQVDGPGQHNYWKNTEPADYEQSSDPLKNDDPNLHQFLQTAYDRGVSVEYLDGHAMWLADDAYLQEATEVCDDVINFNRAAPTISARFDGIHFDIEPHITGPDDDSTTTEGTYAHDWWENPPTDANGNPTGDYNEEWMNRWKTLLGYCRTEIDTYQADTGHAMTLSSDFGTDYAYHNKQLLNYINSSGVLHYITIMNYFDDRYNSTGNADQMFFNGELADPSDPASDPIGGVVQNLNEWSSAPLLIGAEAGSAAPDKNTFRQEGIETLYHVLGKLVADEGTRGNMLGWAVHHYAPNGFENMAMRDPDCVNQTCEDNAICTSTYSCQSMCTQDSECDNGAVCLDNHVCRTPCTTDSDCAAGEVCDDSDDDSIDDACRTACSIPEDCGTDEFCVNGACREH